MPDSKDDNSKKSAAPNGAPEKSVPTEPATVAIQKAGKGSTAPKADAGVKAPKADGEGTAASAPTVAIPKVAQPTPTSRQAPTPPRAPTPPPQRAAPQRVGVAPTPPLAQPMPTRIEPAAPEKTKRSGKGWYIAAAAAGVAVLAAIGIAVFVSSNSGSGESSPEAQVQTAISTYVDALQTGDLATLRTSTCGALGEYYRTIPDAAFAQVHDNAVAQKTIPQVGAVDAVRITDDTAIAQVQASLPSTGEQSWRTFDLERQDGTWKVCDPSK
ncbi:nuclear transport factor 2 family protein [Rhodococcus erythropolis]|uniref:Rv0361 family membrane protein n=1 Tax=Rhodococcus erythropolis TaxID=1833 RepID=UPI001E6083F9|nr:MULTISPECIES: nuclear transport factor 2 family protein [Rhodococcus erythropolis group]MCD2107630.1 nuclear transport factor 2 family protein [Rhodococcus qingshengii]MCZ4524922.1 nuclear transport factor 2 family protein [Rhodococcus erythropolis]